MKLTIKNQLKCTIFRYNFKKSAFPKKTNKQNKKQKQNQRKKEKNKNKKSNNKLKKKYDPALDNYGQSCFVRSDFLKMKCVCKTQMMPPPDHKKL